jgi:hypothetical protein
LTSVENDWRSLFRASALLLPLAGVSALAFGWLAVFYEYNGYAGQSPLEEVTYVGSNALLFNSASIFLTLAVLCLIPAALALYFPLRGTDKGTTLAGTAFVVAGACVILSNVSTAFYYVHEAQLWDGGCTPCGTAPIEAASSTGSVNFANELGFLVILAGVVMLSALMLRGSVFGKISGVLGIVAGLEGIISNFLVANLGTSYTPNPPYVFVAVIPYVLLSLWAISLGPRLLKL